MMDGGLARWMIDVGGRMGASVYCEETGVSLSDWELKRQVVDFPYFVGEI
ncbi:hypothetical protein AB1K89_12180 [Sporosarcina sp. 179-K 8C2 HS]